MLEKVNNKMLNEITELVNQTKSNLVQEINKSIVYVYILLRFRVKMKVFAE